MAWTTWRSEQVSAFRQFARDVWVQLLATYPAELGYFSDSPSALDLTDWAGLPLPKSLDSLLSGNVAAARHLADLLDAVFTSSHPFETVSQTTVSTWLSNAEVGERLQTAFFDADSDAAAKQLSTAFELWSVCARN